MNRKIASLVVVCLLLATGALGGEEPSKPSSVKSTPAWEKLKALSGSWEGFATFGDQKVPSKTSFRVVSDGSAIMNMLDEGGAHEMVTMIHPDRDDLLVTHYCGAHNQPRMKAVSTDGGNSVAFEFKDGTNIGPNDGHMQKVVFTFDGPDRHTQDWTFTDKGKQSTGHFEFRRSK
ncbi:MAG TPA: hypothetical protein VEG32_06375 [Clostridia bacterium]|nr:hypothetical protein [Clostridia bacterium]